MGVNMAVVLDETPTSTGDETHTYPGFGGPSEEDSFALSVCGYAVDASSPDESAGAGIGFGFGSKEDVSGGNDYSLGVRLWNNGRAFTSMYSVLVSMPDTVTGTEGTGGSNWDYVGTFDNNVNDGWTTDGVQLNYSTSDGVARGLHLLLMRGLKNREVMERLVGSGQSSPKTVTTSFKPTLLFFLHMGENSWNQVRYDCRLAWGVAHNDGMDNVTMASFGLYAEHDIGQPRDVRAMIRDDACAFQMDTAEQNTVTVESFTATGFDLAWTNAASDDEVAIAALELDDDDYAHIEVYDTPIATGETAEIVCGFRPGCVIILGSMLTTTGTIKTDATAGSCCMGVSDFISEGCCGMSNEDGEITPETWSSTTEDRILELMDDTGTIVIQAETESRSDTGFTLNFTTVDSQARKIIIVAVKGVLNSVGDGDGDLESVTGIGTGASPTDTPCNVGTAGGLDAITGAGEGKQTYQ